MSASGVYLVSAIAGDAQQNVDFHAGVLGLRLVKKFIDGVPHQPMTR